MYTLQKGERRQTALATMARQHVLRKRIYLVQAPNRPPLEGHCICIYPPAFATEAVRCTSTATAPTNARTHTCSWVRLRSWSRMSSSFFCASSRAWSLTWMSAICRTGKQGATGIGNGGPVRFMLGSRRVPPKEIEPGRPWVTHEATLFAEPAVETIHLIFNCTTERQMAELLGRDSM